MYEPDDRVELVATTAKRSRVRPGDRGTVLRDINFFDRYHLVFVKWDSGWGGRVVLGPNGDEIRKVD
jgi:hypothetical protein